LLSFHANKVYIPLLKNCLLGVTGENAVRLAVEAKDAGSAPVFNRRLLEEPDSLVCGGVGLKERLKRLKTLACNLWKRKEIAQPNPVLNGHLGDLGDLVQPHAVEVAESAHASARRSDLRVEFSCAMENLEKWSRLFSLVSFLNEVSNMLVFFKEM